MLQRFRDWLDKHGPFDLTLDGTPPPLLDAYMSAPAVADGY
jgi:hypothetical protein